MFLLLVANVLDNGITILLGTGGETTLLLVREIMMTIVIIIMTMLMIMTKAIMIMTMIMVKTIMNARVCTHTS